jgi:putative protein kinase ArgK-like GTPase of G3E family
VGTEAVVAAVDAFHARALQSGRLAEKRRAHLRHLFEETLRERVLGRVEARALSVGEREAIVDRLAARETDPFTATDEVLGKAGL